MQIQYLKELPALLMAQKGGVQSQLHILERKSTYTYILLRRLLGGKLSGRSRATGSSQQQVAAKLTASWPTAASC